MNNLLIVFIGGGIGSMSRYILARWVQFLSASIFPFGTLSVNMVGSFALGMIAGFAGGKLVTNLAWRNFLAVGFCGGFSTFSSFSFETFELIRNGHPYMAVVNVAVSVVLSVGGYAAGFLLSGKV